MNARRAHASTGGIPAAIVRRLRSVRYAVGRRRLRGRRLRRATRRFGAAGSRGRSARARRLLGLALGRSPAAGWSPPSGRRGRCSLSSRVAVPNLPCAFPGGDSCPPADDADRARARPTRSPTCTRTSTPRPTSTRRRAELAGRLPAVRRPGRRPGAGADPGPGRRRARLRRRRAALVRRRGGARGRSPGPAAAPSASTCSRSTTPTARRASPSSLAVGAARPRTTRASS